MTNKITMLLRVFLCIVTVMVGEFNIVADVSNNMYFDPEVKRVDRTGVGFSLVAPLLTGWNQKASMPSGAANKYVKDGGALVAVGDSILYAFRGNRSNEFYKYIIARDSWTRMESIPYGYKPGTTIINKKKVGKGAALCYDGDNTIYATKGRSIVNPGTKEFWAYRINDVVLPETTLPGNTWHAKEFVIAPSGLLGGTALTYKDDKVYLLAGGQKAANNNFYAYYVTSNAWTTLANAPLSPGRKVYRDGSCLTLFNDTIYALKGGGIRGYKRSYFYAYDGTNWTLLDSIPKVDTVALTPRLKTKKVNVKYGASMTSGGGKIYIIKGGGSTALWKYTRASGWSQSVDDAIPRLNNKSVPKTGAALAYADGKVYLLKGNNTPEFWQYTTGSEIATLSLAMTEGENNVMAQTTELKYPFLLYQSVPNPFRNQTTIRYSLPVEGKVSLQLCDISGRLVKTLVDEQKKPGNYKLTLNTKPASGGLSAGVYFLYLQTESKRIIKRLVVVK